MGSPLGVGEGKAAIPTPYFKAVVGLSFIGETRVREPSKVVPGDRDFAHLLAAAAKKKNKEHYFPLRRKGSGKNKAN